MTLEIHKSDRISVLKEMTIWFWRGKKEKKQLKQITGLCPAYDRRKMSEGAQRKAGWQGWWWKASEKARRGI